MENKDFTNLKDIAAQAKENYKITDTSIKGVDVVDNTGLSEKNDEEKNSSISQDDGVTIIGFNSSDVSSMNVTEEDLITSSNEKTKPFEITDEDLRTVMPDLTDEAFKTVTKDLKVKLDKYRKSLIINNGFTVEEANEAVQNKMKKDGKEINDEYLKNNPKLGIVEIDKKNQDKVEFTAEEKEKLTKSKAIRLVVVEDEELKSIKIDKVDKKHKAAFVKSVEGSLSKYSVPLPILGDFVTFKGSQIIQLMSIVKYEDDKFEDLIAKKASLVYDRLLNGTVFNKYDEFNKVIMSYVDFANQFPFHDLDMAMYAILVASSMEESESTLTCANCREAFQQKYNLKALLNLDNMSDYYKEITDEILGNKSNEDILKSIQEKLHKISRYKSPFTNNIYDITFPSVAKAVKLFNAIDQKDETMMYLSALGIFMDSIYLYNRDTDSYMQIEESETTLMMETLQSLPQKDIDMLFNQIKDMIYAPEFILNSQCPHCGEKMRNKISIDDLIFLKAQDLSTEIR